MVNACSDPQPHTQTQTTHTITDAHTHTCKHIREQIITQRLTQVLSPTNLPPPSPSPLFVPLALKHYSEYWYITPSSFFSLSLSLSVSLSLHHSLSLLNTDRLSTPWSEFQISPSLSLPPLLHPLQKKSKKKKQNSNIKEEIAEVNALR